jgi:hypothetical protein
VGSIADEVRLEPKAVIEGQGSHSSYQETHMPADRLH